MADIRFACPHCNQHLVVDDEGIGLEVPCPHCGETVVIPRLQEEQEPPASEEESPTPEEESPAPEEESPAPEDPEPHRKEDSPAPTVAPPEPSAASAMTSSLASALHRQQAEAEERHSQDVNVDQPLSKKKDQWFSTNHKKYHYCYYDPHSPEMRTACGSEVMPITADVAPIPITRLRKGALCKKCLEALGLAAEDVLS